MMKKLFLALAVVAVAAGCAKENGGNVDDGAKDLSLRLHLPGEMVNSTLSRADSDISASNQISVWHSSNNTNGTSWIFVLNAMGNVIAKEELEANAIMPASPAGTEGQYLGEVPTDATVYVVANIPTAKVAEVSGKTTIAGIHEVVEAMKDYHSGTNNYRTPLMVNTGGTATPIEDASSMALGTDSGTNGGASVPDYVANVDIKPAYARVELLSLQSESPAAAKLRHDADATDVTGYISAYTVSGVYVDDVYYSFTYDAGHDGTLEELGQDPAKLPTWVSNGMGVTGTWTPRSVGTAPNANLVTAHNGDPSDWVTTPTTEAWGFNVPAGSAARLVVVLTGVKYKEFDGDSDYGNDVEKDAGTQYLTVTGYSTSAGGVAVNTPMEAGKVYKVGLSSAGTGTKFEFGLDNLYITPNPTNVDLVVRVTVKDWEFVGYHPILAK